MINEEIIEIVPVTMAERTLMSKTVKKFALYVRYMRKQLVIECRKARKDTRATLRSRFAGVLAEVRRLPKDSKLRQEVEAGVADTINMAEERVFNLLQNEMERKIVTVLGDGYHVVMRRIQIMEEFEKSTDEATQVQLLTWIHQLTVAPEMISYYRMDESWDGVLLNEFGSTI